MAYGLQVYNASGALRLDTTDLIHRLVYTGSINTVGAPGAGVANYVSAPGVVPGDAWFAVLIRQYVDSLVTVVMDTNQIILYNYGSDELIYYAIYRR